MKVLVTGAAGQVGRALQASVPRAIEARALSRAELNITHPEAVSSLIDDWKPERIINAAAYTAVDKAESDIDAAMAINADGPRYLAAAASTVPRCRLIHLSTDYVFAGDEPEPYAPEHPTGPVSVYGRSKLAGERAVLEILPQRSIVLRTAWVYAAEGRNFLLTMLRLMRERGSVHVVADQFGTPTSADSIARACWAIAAQPSLHGIIHWTDAGRASWHDFARAIAEDALAAGLLTRTVTVTPITTADYPTAASRPANSVLDTRDSIVRLGITPRPWREELRVTLARIRAVSDGQLL